MKTLTWILTFIVWLTGAFSFTYGLSIILEQGPVILGILFFIIGIFCSFFFCFWVFDALENEEVEI